jgi:hypothetical protein
MLGRPLILIRLQWAWMQQQEHSSAMIWHKFAVTAGAYSNLFVNFVEVPGALRFLVIDECTTLVPTT